MIFMRPLKIIPSHLVPQRLKLNNYHHSPHNSFVENMFETLMLHWHLPECVCCSQNGHLLQFYTDMVYQEYHVNTYKVILIGFLPVTIMITSITSTSAATTTATTTATVLVMMTTTMILII